METGTAGLLIGPTGCGKTSVIRAACAKLERPYRRIPVNGQTSIEELVGYYTLKESENGSETVWVDGILTLAMKHGMTILVDEINMAEPDVLAILNAILDDDKMIVLKEEGKVIRPHPEFRVFATMNEGDGYSGTKPLNLALRDRFGIVLNYEYPVKYEKKILIHATLPDGSELGEEAYSRYATVFSKIRAANKAGEIEGTISTRRIENFCAMMSRFGEKKAYDIAIKSQFSDFDQEVLKTLLEISG